jgi:hypothetical protein
MSPNFPGPKAKKAQSSMGFFPFGIADFLRDVLE